MKKLLSALLFGLSTAFAEPGFNLEYRVEGPFPLKQDSTRAHISYDKNIIQGEVYLPLYIFKPFSISFYTDLENDVHKEDGELISVPEGYMALLEGFLHYINYIKNNDNICSQRYNLFVTDKRKEVCVEVISNEGSKLEVEVYPLFDKFLIEDGLIKVPRVEIEFESNTPVEAFAYVKVLGFEAVAEGYLKP